MRHQRTTYTILLSLLLLVGTACSSSDDSDEQAPAPSDTQGTGDVGTITDMDPNFDLGSLPDDFPDNLKPDSFTAGMYVELGDIRNTNFESSASFDEVVAEYTDKIGDDPILVEGEERLASWVVGDWVVSVIDTTPTTIGVATSG